MNPRVFFSIIYAPIIKTQIKAIEPKYYTLIQDEIKRHLSFEPEVETRNRKPLKRPVSFGAKWELRCGLDNRFRVFYIVSSEYHQVHILAIGVKIGNKLLIGGKEIEP
jgi:hypothetical protein